MSNIITDIKKIDFSRSAITFFCPNGKIICINKIKDFDLHIKYLKLLAKNDKDIKNILAGFDINYYLDNPAKVLTDIMPEFAKNNYSVYINLNPNVLKPTNCACFVLPENVSKSTKTLLNKFKEKFLNIIFIDIVRYNRDSDFIESCLGEQYNDEPNYERILELINTAKINNNKNSKM